MSTTPNLMIALLQQSQNLKYLTCNDAFDAIDAALTAVFVQPMADANQTPTAAQALACMVIQCTGAMTATRGLILPNIPKIYVIHNLTTGGYQIQVTAPTTGAVVVVDPNEDIMYGSPAVILSSTGAQFVYCDGNNNFYSM